MTGGWIRLLLEALFLVGVAAVTWLAKLTAYPIIAVMAVAWVLVAIFERTASRGAGRTSAAEAEEASAIFVPDTSAEEPAPGRARFWQRRGPPAPAEPPAVEAGEPAQAEASPEAVVAVEEPAPTELPAPSVEQPEPVRALPSVPPPPPILVGVPTPPPEPVPAPEPPRAPTPPRVVRLPVAGVPREWNLWELERLARQLGGADVDRDEEWSALLMHLRQFANTDGNLPVDFDLLVRESFADLISPVEAR